MEYIVRLENVEFDVNGGEYTQIVNEELSLGIIEANSLEEAQLIGNILKDEAISKYGHESVLGYPSLVIENIQMVKTIKMVKYLVTYLDYSNKENKIEISILNNFFPWEEVGYITSQVDEDTNFKCSEILSIEEI